MHKGFTLIEMLVVIGIIAVLLAALTGGYSKLTRAAERAKAQELVANAATALTALYQERGAWPSRIRANSGGQLDAEAAKPLAIGGYLSLSTNMVGSAVTLAGYDRFGVVTPWAQAAIRRAGTGASLSTKVAGTTKTVLDHILYYAVDKDGDGIIDNVAVGGETISVRATAIVWSAGKDGVLEPYSQGLRRDDVYSWTVGQTRGL